MAIKQFANSRTPLYFSVNIFDRTKSFKVQGVSEFSTTHKKSGIKNSYTHNPCIRSHSYRLQSNVGIGMVKTASSVPRYVFAVLDENNKAAEVIMHSYNDEDVILADAFVKFYKDNYKYYYNKELSELADDYDDARKKYIAAHPSQSQDDNTK